MTRKSYKYKVGDRVLTPVYSPRMTRRKFKTDKKYIETIITGKTSAGGVKMYRLANGGLKEESDILPIKKATE